MSIKVAAALIYRGGRFLLCQRPVEKARGLQWEFPGGKLEPGETPQQAIVREIREELSFSVSAGGIAAEVTYSYPDVTVHLALVECTPVSGEPQLLEHRAMRWVTAQEAAVLDLCPADRELLSAITDSME